MARTKKEHEDTIRKDKLIPSTKVTNSTSFKAVTSEKKLPPTAATYNLQESKRKHQTKPKGFQVWRQNRTGKNEIDNDNHSQGEVNILHVVHPDDNDDGKRHALSPSESVCTSVSQQALSPDMFDSLADQIVDRVKKELNLNSTGQMPMDQRVDRKVYSPKAYASGRVSSKTSTTKIDSHYCPGCGLLMVSNNPLIIILNNIIFIAFKKIWRSCVYFRINQPDN